MDTTPKTETLVNSDRVKMHLQSRFNPIRGLTPERLSARLDQFDRGYLREAALLWQKIRDRDDQVITMTQKRELSASMLNWEISTIDESPEAANHKQALEEFYNSLTTTNAIDENIRGGVAKLIEQMMHAVGHKYAVHEIVWKPSTKGLSAEFRFTPLEFFENTSGRLRFLQQDFGVYGIDLEDGGWMITTGPGLMEATSISYMFKQMPLKDWLIFSEKAGLPGLIGKTDAPKGSPEWENLKEALANYGIDWSLVVNQSANISTVDLKGGGQLPYPDLVDRMDRAIARIWRGSDLSTMSAKSSVGSNPQQDEVQVYELADAMRISETLQYFVDRWVIQYRFGTTPKAYFKLHPRDLTNVELEIKTDEALISWGAPVAIRDLLARYGRGEPEPGEELASAPAPTAPFGQGAPAAMANDARAARGRAALFAAAALRKLEPKVREVIAPLAERMTKIAAMTDGPAQREALKAFKGDLPELYKAAIAKVPESAPAWEQVLGTALVSGFAEASKAKT